ncbi:MAG: hypothetical protein H0X39_11495 [Actinobacteria bacterium]|nr:hypothetical protein [Actinomycetota bacterium]
MSAWIRRPLAREAIVSAVVAAVLAGVLLWLGPPGVDLAAHAYQRTFLLQHGFAIWNNFWYAGRYSFVTYSFIYYPLVAVLGIKVVAVVSMAIAALAFALVVGREWGTNARFSSRAFAVLWPGVVLTAAFPFALGITLALLALVCIQRGHRRLFAVAIFLALLASPLAFLLVVLVLAGGALERPPRRATVAVILSAVLLELVLRRLFPGQGRFPFSVADLIPGTLFGVLGVAVTARVPGARRLFGLFAVFLAAMVVAFVFPSDLGSNVERLKFMAIPLAVLAAALAPKRVLLVVPLVAVAGFWNLSALAHTAQTASADPGNHQLYWRPAIKYLRAHLSPSFRVEAVDTAEHWPAAYLPDAGIPIVRGWYRQNDFPQNELLYDKNLGEHTYQAWLHALGVQFVVITDAPPDYSARAEATLVRSGRAGLERVFHSAHVDIYRLSGASPIITGAGDANIFWMYPTRMVFSVSKPGRYRVKVRWSPYWQTSQGCVWRGTDGGLRVQAYQPGLIDLHLSVSVSSGLQALAGRSPQRVCADRE